MRKDKVVIGFLGTQLDSGKGAGRWEKWRPTVSLVQHEDVVIERLELIFSPPQRELAHQVRADMATASPETTVNLVPLPIADPWDF
ncbi:MAG: sigma 54-dependent transcriptional regulator, partial [Gammaproteobacteria bacterium]|nr:sigma 54-dependent transcriptional regulator [Gammaproteobacteria bacterium]